MLLDRGTTRRGGGGRGEASFALNENSTFDALVFDKGGEELTFLICLFSLFFNYEFHNMPIFKYRGHNQPKNVVISFVISFWQKSESFKTFTR